MLKIFRNNTKIIVWVTVAALALLFGAGSIADLVGGKKNGRYAGEVFGKTVTFQDYNRFYRATQLFMPSDKPVDDPDLLRQYTWQNIIYSREAKRNGINVSDQEVRGEISKILEQQGLANPTNEQYKIWLTRSLHLSPPEFEEGLREFIRIQKLIRVKISGFAPKGIEKITDAKEKGLADEKQKSAFMTWSGEVNKRAAFKDYLALPTPEEETPAPESVERLGTTPAGTTSTETAATAQGSDKK